VSQHRAFFSRLLRWSPRKPVDGETLEQLHERELAPADTAGGDAALAGLDEVSRIGPLGEPPADLDAEFKPPPDY
jgi:hypothetical protein